MASVACSSPEKSYEQAFEKTLTLFSMSENITDDASITSTTAFDKEYSAVVDTIDKGIQRNSDWEYISEYWHLRGSVHGTAMNTYADTKYITKAATSAGLCVSDLDYALSQQHALFSGGSNIGSTRSLRDTCSKMFNMFKGPADTLIYLAEQTTLNPEKYGVVNSSYSGDGLSFVPVIYEKATASEPQATAYANHIALTADTAFFPHRYLRIINGYFTISGLDGWDNNHAALKREDKESFREKACEISENVFGGLPVTREFYMADKTLSELTDGTVTADETAEYIMSRPETKIYSVNCSSLQESGDQPIPASKDYVPQSKN